MLSPGGVGSSPHTRGAPDHDVSLALEIGIIPAYAGSTPGRGGATGPHRDHPRIRGEHTPRRLTVSMMSGSSPHTRGALLRLLHPRARRGIIPAYAGSTELDLACDAELLGSSPHTRGALHDRMGGSPWPGIIPAYAGSTSEACRNKVLREDHPRIRGEHVWKTERYNLATGSSPHTRGARCR